MLFSWKKHSYIGKDSGSQPKHELIIEPTNSENQKSSGETISVDSNHHEEKDGDETFQGNEDTLMRGQNLLREKIYLRDRKTREFPDFVAYIVISNYIDEPSTVDDALSSEYSDEWVNAIKSEMESLHNNETGV
ncbi:hypothetical protein JTB14_026752 [Gonioctena quinquepunctata]|nr:hypothetical protein JTB14_026752 [Gonioctena quinquepunctata]